MKHTNEFPVPVSVSESRLAPMSSDYCDYKQQASDNDTSKFQDTLRYLNKEAR